MSLPPEYVPQVQEIAAKARAIERMCEALLKEIGTPADDVCAQCCGLGTFSAPLADGTWASAPCTCPKGAPFRAAAATQRMKDSRAAAAGRDE